MVHFSRVISGISDFFDRDLVSKMNGSWKAWGLGTCIALIARKGPDVFRKISENAIVRELGLIDGEMVDVDAIYQELKKQAARQSATVEIPIIGSVTYSSEDVDNLYRCIMGC